MNGISNVTLICIIVILIGVSALFSAAEIGLMSLNRYRLRHMVKKRVKMAIRVEALLLRTDRLLGVILIGNTFANVVGSSAATVLAMRYFDEYGVALCTLLLTFIILIFGEVAPKTLASVHPQKTAFFSYWPLFILSKLLWLFVVIVNGLSNAFLRLFGVKIREAKNEQLSHEELRSVVHDAGELIPGEHKQMLLSIFDLEQVTVDDIMVPRSEIIGLDLTQEWSDILEQLQNSQHTRLPIYKTDIDNVMGIVHVRSVLNLMAEERLNKERLLEVVEETYFVPEATPLNTQLINFKNAKCRIGLVVDEYGDIQGLVTLEDILEEIVGEFTTDNAALSRDIHYLEDGSVMVDGSAMIRDINRALQLHLPVTGPKTLNGLIVEYLECIPGGATSMKISGNVIEVVQVSGSKVVTAKIFPRKKKSKRTVHHE